MLADVFKTIEDDSGNVLLLSTGSYVGYTTELKAGSNLCEGEIVAIPWGGSPNVKYFKGKFVTADNRIATSMDVEILTNKYLYYWLSSKIKYLESIYRGASIKHPSMSDVLNMQIVFSSKAEQERISLLLQNLDNLITLHQRKYDKLVNVKKSLLEKMFPFGDERVPKIRFKGFTEAWEQRKVSELLIERNEQAPKSREYPLMAFIANEGVASKGDRYDRSSLVNDTENKPYKKTEYGDFIYSSNNLETGSIGVNKYGKASISPVYSIFYTTKLADSDFVGRRLVRRDFINEMVKWRQGVIYGQWRIHEDDFVKIEIFVPKVDEQHKIGTILDNLDNLITLHQRKLEKLKNIKKSLLEKMFV